MSAAETPKLSSPSASCALPRPLPFLPVLYCSLTTPFGLVDDCRQWSSARSPSG